jgi:hypothetical protein
MAVATELGLMPNHFYCLLKAYETDPRSRSLLPEDPGPQAVGAVSISASRQPPFARLSPGSSSFQALRLPTTVRLMISGEKWCAQSASRRRTCQRSQRRHFPTD